MVRIRFPPAESHRRTGLGALPRRKAAFRWATGAAANPEGIGGGKVLFGLERARTFSDSLNPRSFHESTDFEGSEEVPNYSQGGRSFVPACSCCGTSRAGAVKAGRSVPPPAGLGLDGSEHGATLMQVGTPSRASSRTRMRAPF
jgi:hypothetical protein